MHDLMNGPSCISFLITWPDCLIVLTVHGSLRSYTMVQRLRSGREGNPFQVAFTYISSTRPDEASERACSTPLFMLIGQENVASGDRLSLLFFPFLFRGVLLMAQSVALALRSIPT